VVRPRRRDRHTGTELGRLVAIAAPSLVAVKGVGTEVAGALLSAAGDNPERLVSEASFAALCGASPIEASSGRNQRHRLNRGGDRQANCVLFTVVLNRITWDDRTGGLHGQADRRRQVEARRHPLPQALRRPRALPGDSQDFGRTDLRLIAGQISQNAA